MIWNWFESEATSIQRLNCYLANFNTDFWYEPFPTKYIFLFTVSEFERNSQEVCSLKEMSVSFQSWYRAPFSTQNLGFFISNINKKMYVFIFRPVLTCLSSELTHILIPRDENRGYLMIILRHWLERLSGSATYFCLTGIIYSVTPQILVLQLSGISHCIVYKQLAEVIFWSAFTFSLSLVF